MDNIRQEYDEALKFWDNGYEMTAEKKAEQEQKWTPDSDPMDLAYSRQLASIIRDELRNQTHVLVYGCGRGWAGMLLRKAGCEKVLGVDVSARAAESAKHLAALLGITDGYEAQAIDVTWLSSVPDDAFDGAVTVNVLDVIPPDVTEGILTQLRRVTAPGAKIVIAMNYYMEPKDNPEKNTVIRYGNHVFLSGILRMVTRTDEEWQDIFSRYFRVDTLRHYAWNTEEIARRRVFTLSNSKA